LPRRKRSHQHSQESIKYGGARRNLRLGRGSLYAGRIRSVRASRLGEPRIPRALAGGVSNPVVGDMSSRLEFFQVREG